MHPQKDELKSFVEGTLDALSSNEVGKHIEACELCREFCEDYRLLIDSEAKARLEDVPPNALKLADRLYNDALRANAIELSVLSSEKTDPDFLLAADSQGRPISSVRNLATLYSEDPEIVLRVMHDSNKSKNYLQLISDDSKLVSYVMVQIPALEKEYITDENGHVAIENDIPADYDKLIWQIKLPNAVFDLKPLSYDPDKIEYSKEMILETDKHDKIQVSFMGKTEGKQISLRILEIDGNTKFENTKIIISQKKNSKLCEIKPNESVSFDIFDSDDVINIRLFHK